MAENVKAFFKTYSKLIEGILNFYASFEGSFITNKKSLKVRKIVSRFVKSTFHIVLKC